MPLSEEKKENVPKMMMRGRRGKTMTDTSVFVFVIGFFFSLLLHLQLAYLLSVFHGEEGLMKEGKTEHSSNGHLVPHSEFVPRLLSLIR
jgi:hypothetical protein